jgi:tRNA pseudouridine38-40 synthase
VVSFDTSSRISPAGLERVLDTVLPEDVWVSSTEEAASDFDARRSARRRWYRYAVWRHASPPAEWHGRALPYPKPLDLDPMRTASQSLLGTHDFGAFATRPSQTTTVRTVLAADWLRVSDRLWLFEICADAFLKQMVRAIVGSSLLVGSGRWSPEDFTAAAASTERQAAGPNAPALGLTLHRIDY